MGQSGAARVRQACRALEAVGTGARDATIRRAHGAMSAQLRRVTLLALLARGCMRLMERGTGRG